MITVPTFVTRGMNTMDSPDLEVPGVHYTTEADLRDGMATIWWLNGWNVRTEVKVPDCGRIDVLAEMGASTVVIELKKSISTPTQARQAFQQAHAYSAYLQASDFQTGRRRRFTTIVTAATWEEAAVEAASRAYLDVEFQDFTSASRVSVSPHGWFGISPEVLDEAGRIARHRASQLQVLAGAARAGAVRATRAVEDRSSMEAEAS